MCVCVCVCVLSQMQVLTGEGELIEAPDRLQGRGTPLCADFDGNTGVMAVGCADGALVTFGYRWATRCMHPAFS